MFKHPSRLLITLILLCATTWSAMAAGTTPVRDNVRLTYSSTPRAGSVTQEGEPDIGLGAKPPSNSNPTPASKEALLKWITSMWVAQYLWR